MEISAMLSSVAFASGRCGNLKRCGLGALSLKGTGHCDMGIQGVACQDTACLIAICDLELQF